MLQDPERLTLNRRQTLGLVGVLLLAFAASLGMAFNVDAIAVSYAVSNGRAGFVASTEMASIACGTLFFARLIGRFPARRVYALGVPVIIGCNLLSVLMPSVLLLALTRVPAGIALGAVVATVMATAGRSDRPEQTFGYINAAVGLMGIVVALVLPRAMGLGSLLPQSWSISAIDGLYVVYAIAGVLALLFITSTPSPVAQTNANQGGNAIAIRHWVSMVGLGVLFFGHGLLAVFFVRIGRDALLDPAQIGYVFMAAGVVGVIAPLVAGHLATRLPALWLTIALCLTLLLLLPVLGLASSPLPFILSAPLYAAIPTALMPIFLGAAANVEPTGRLTAAHPAFIMIGGALAPVLGGVLSDSGGFIFNAQAAAVCIILGFLLMRPVLQQADGYRNKLT